MAQTAAGVDALWAAFRALPTEARDQFMERIVADSMLREGLEDLLDLAVARERVKEPVTRSAEVQTVLDDGQPEGPLRPDKPC